MDEQVDQDELSQSKTSKKNTNKALPQQDTKTRTMLNNDELGVIFSFIPPQELIMSVQLASKNFHQKVTNQEILWKKYCDEYFLDDLFNWENDLFTKSLQIDENCKYFTLFCEWSKSIPRIELVGRYPTLSNYNSGAEHERSIFSRFYTSKYSFRNLTQLVILLNVFSLSKYDKEFNNDFQDVYKNCSGYPFDEQVANAKFTPYDFVPSIWGHSVTITLSDRNNYQFRYGYAMQSDEEYCVISKKIPFGAFCLMILSENQNEKISLIRNILSKSLTESTIEDCELGVSVPNDDEESINPVCYFNRMHKWFKNNRSWSDDKDFYPDETWLPSYKSGFVTRYEFYENVELKKVTMERELFYP